MQQCRDVIFGKRSSDIVNAAIRYHANRRHLIFNIDRQLQLLAKAKTWYMYMDAAVSEEGDTTDGESSVQPVAAVLREEHQRQSVAAGVRIHLRTTWALLFTID